ncbi:MAG TPA: retroviral-like aspartic protease family protein [Pyrinomonadaceae bacterium]|nr:retroviral-like aspartic protease family protein [Pyrinomonadaceae bacterium]
MTLKLKPKGERKMGLTRVAVELRKPGSKEALSQTLLVDTGATDSMISTSVLRRLGILPIDKRTYELATGELQDFEVGYAEMSFMDDTIQTRVIFGPDNTEPILGAIALELAGLMVDPSNEALRKIPGHPFK